jgi:hypothetical protein
VSPSRRSRTRIGIVVAAGVAVTAAAAFAVTALDDDTSPAAVGGAATTSAAPAGDVAAAGAPATSSAPYTIKPEPADVATDEPVDRDKGDVDVVLTYADADSATGTVQASGFVAGILEDGGTCTLTLTNRGTEITVRSTATADATTTTCGLLETAPGIPAGRWTAVLSYTSAKAEGTSRTAEVSVR